MATGEEVQVVLIKVINLAEVDLTGVASENHVVESFVRLPGIPVVDCHSDFRSVEEKAVDCVHKDVVLQCSGDYGGAVRNNEPPRWSNHDLLGNEDFVIGFDVHDFDE